MSDYSCYCEVGGGEMPDWSRDNWRKARKEHKCCECREKIVPGERYRYYVGKWDGEIQTFKRCEYCHDLAAEFDAHAHYDELIPFGQLACYAMNAPEVEPAVMIAPFVVTPAGGSGE